MAEGTWHSPHINASSKSSPDPQNNKAVVAQSSRPSDGSTRECVEDGRKTGNAMECWLFGVNLTSSSSNVAPLEKELGYPNPCGPKESLPVGACETGRVQTPNNHSLSNKGQKKQAPVPSMRTRTKVHFQP